MLLELVTEASHLAVSTSPGHADAGLASAELALDRIPGDEINCHFGVSVRSSSAAAASKPRQYGMSLHARDLSTERLKPQQALA